MKDIVIFIDSGDTLVDERTEVRNENGDVIHSELIPGAHKALSDLYGLGYTIALVADGTVKSFDNIYEEQNLSHCFHVRAVSEAVGKEKPNAEMFQTAMDLLNLSESDKQRIVMIGNNLERDIAGANRFGITSIWLRWTSKPCYKKQIEYKDEIPDYIIETPNELVCLIEMLNEQFRRKKECM